MPLLYESPRGRIFMSWLGSYSAETPRWPVARKLPPWLKTVITLLFSELKAHGYDPSKDARAAEVLWEYVLDIMSDGAPGMAAEAEMFDAREVLGDMLAALRPSG